jgi:hypothetical protein
LAGAVVVAVGVAVGFVVVGVGVVSGVQETNTMDNTVMRLKEINTIVFFIFTTLFLF